MDVVILVLSIVWVLIIVFVNRIDWYNKLIIKGKKSKRVLKFRLNPEASNLIFGGN